MIPEHDTPNDADFPLSDFWSYVDIYALGVAQDDFQRCAGDDNAFIRDLATEIVRLRVGIVIEHLSSESTLNSEAQPWEVRDENEERLLRQIRDLKEEVRQTHLEMARRDPADWPKELRFAVELQLGWRFLDRARRGLDRYADLQPMLVRRRVPNRVQPYLAELVDLYLVGFDAATVAFACACFEQVAKGALVATGKCTEPQLRRDKPTALALHALLVQHSLIEASDRLADRLVRNRNDLLHSHWPDPKIDSRRQALDAIESLVSVCRELEAAWPRS